MRRLFLAVMLLGLGACTQRAVPWVNPALPVERASTDLADCRRWADDRIDPGRVAEEPLSQASPLRTAERSEARRRIDTLVAACMRSKGYRAKSG